MDHNSSQFKEWVSKLIHTHQDKRVQLPLPKFKQFAPKPGDQEEIQSRIDSFKQQIAVERVELQKARTIGEWLSDKKQVRIIRQSGTKVLSLGHQNAQGKFLTPFEALFLLETNRLEILEDEVPWTLSKAYRTILVTNEDILKYKGYRKFTLDGCSIRTPISTLEEPRHARKKFKTTHTSSSFAASENLPEIGNSYPRTFNDIFEDLRAAGPRKKAFVDHGAHSAESFMTSEQFHNEDFGDAGNVLCFTREYSTLRIQRVEVPNLPPPKDS